MNLDGPIEDAIPSPEAIRHRLGRALREAYLLRKLLRLAKRAESCRKVTRIRRKLDAMDWPRQEATAS
jgi:hypothetical protein